MKKDLVSVIIPLFGDFDPTKVEMCIDSIKSQRDVDLEIVVAEQTKIPKLNQVKGISYQHFPTILSDDGFFMPGKVRNYAAKMATGEFLYNNDGDILFFKENYLKKLVEILKNNQNLCLYQPQMRRLPIENFEEFEKRYQGGGLQFAISTLDISQPYGATYSNHPIRIRHFKKILNEKEEISVATETDHRKYLSAQNKGKEPFFYTLEIHAGGILMRRHQFDFVGGYCEDYAGWGCHDEDIQWKLRSSFNLQQVPKSADLEVLHLDHPRQYFSETRWNKNREIQRIRKDLSIAVAIDSDKMNLRGKND